MSPDHHTSAYDAMTSIHFMSDNVHLSCRNVNTT